MQISTFDSEIGAVLNLLFAKKTIDAASPFCHIEAMANNKTNQTTLTHKHHIIPKHAGGTDDPDNLMELTVAEHAEAHRRLYEEYGRWQDLWAYHILAWEATQDPKHRREAKLLEGKNLAEWRMANTTPEQRSAIAKKAGKAANGKGGKIGWRVMRAKYTNEEYRKHQSKAGKRGYKAGLGKLTKAELSALSKGTHWYNNGRHNTRCLPGTQPKGFIRGRLTNHK